MAPSRQKDSGPSGSDASGEDPIYLDYNATTPVAPEVRAAMDPYLRARYGNPSSPHWAGRPARQAVQKGRRQVANLLGAAPEEIVFTSGGSEANNHALKGAVCARKKPAQAHLITTRIEHPAVTEPSRYLSTLGAEVTRLPVDGNGRVDPEDVKAALRPNTVLVSVMHANNEVGTIQPIEAIGELVRDHEALFHTDAAQTVGKIPVDVDELGVDLLSVAGHKLYAPKGVGALYVREGTTLEPLIHGAGHEHGRRAGTESVPLIAGLGAACVLADQALSSGKIEALRDDFWSKLQEAVGRSELVLNGHPDHRLPNTLSVGFRGVGASALLNCLEGVAASTGSACHEDSEERSPVLAAMGISEEVERGTVRISLGRSTTRAEIDRVIERVVAALDALGTPDSFSRTKPQRQ